MTIKTELSSVILVPNGMNEFILDFDISHRITLAWSKTAGSANQPYFYRSVCASPSLIEIGFLQDKSYGRRS